MAIYGYLILTAISALFSHLASVPFRLLPLPAHCARVDLLPINTQVLGVQLGMLLFSYATIVFFVISELGITAMLTSASRDIITLKNEPQNYHTHTYIYIYIYQVVPMYT